MPRHFLRWPTRFCALFCVVTLAALVLLACAPASPLPPRSAAPPAAAQPTKAPAATAVPAAAGSGARAPGADAQSAASMAARPDRMIIRSAEIDLLATDTDAAMDQVLGVVSDVAGYVLNTSTWQEGPAKLAKVTMRMPFDRYEEALRRLRRIGTVQKETSTGEDVTDQYVDLEAQQRNLEATAERLRGFLAKANTVDEALKVNQALQGIEGDIEKVKGRLNYLGDRAAFSTISVYIHPALPTPTPTPTPVPAMWNPLNTAGRAGGVLVDIYKAMVDVSIWVIIVVVPVLGLPAALIWWFGWGRRRWGAKPRGGGAAAA